MYYALGVALALAAFLSVNAVGSLVAAGLAGRALASPSAEDPRRRVQRLLAWRLLPSLVSAVCVLGFVVPAYLLFEPRDAREVPGATLLLLAAGAAGVIAAATRRGLLSWRSTARRLRCWMADAEALPSENGVALYRIHDRFPVVSLVGLTRPRILVAQQVLEALTPAELSAVVAHETGHWRSRDNLKRLAFRCCPDVLALLPAGRRLEQEWARASEMAADDDAARDEVAALDLGAALVKVARLVPPGGRAAWATSALHDGEDVSARVRRLVACGARPRTRSGSTRGTLAWSALGLAGVLLAATSLPWVHSLVELAVRHLP